MSGSRQQPGLACEECRKKKLRCDRRRPQCDQCEDAGTACYVNQVRSPRGPKKGHLKALRNRIATLESIIKCDKSNLCSKETLELSERCVPENETRQILSAPQGYALNASVSEHYSVSNSFKESFANAPITPPDQESADIIEADLDQLYFDRVHPVAPILHQGRYFFWAQKCYKSDPQICLQLAMWALAAASSPHLQHIRVSLYRRARSKLEALDSNIESTDAASLQAAQAWLLITNYEFRYMGYCRAWLTAGRAFRIIQLAKLHEMDRLNDVGLNITMPEIWAEAEEKRRTYWLAYCLDRLLNISEEWPLSLQEEAVGTAAIATNLQLRTKNASPFAETIVLTTLCWHSVAFQRTAADDHTFPNASSDIWKQHTRLYQAVQQRLMLLSLPASSPELNDPMRLFTNMLANSAVIWFHNMLESLQTDLDEQMLLFPLYSAYEIVRLAKPLTRCSYFKAHPFSPMLLFLSAKFLKAHAECPCVSEDKQQRLEELKKALRVLQGGNNLAMNYVELLESDCFHKLCNLSPLQGSVMPNVAEQSEPSFFLDIMNLF
ncbi:uncharacterized protein N7529_006489 [Penicillium soppii]|uniref:uncharacterized protein n=1 Tax=Penicillium soppii TaxID=69789 RepID=UPI00254993FF|nr:uncharacterized protein N7529_006489 [Penicillium soppii]KAJ5864573.1 hypothetical protein N7529_006489 [Penicillium soppii]